MHKFELPELTSEVPFNPRRASLYTCDELLSGYADGGYTNTLDFKIFTHFDRLRSRHGHCRPEAESLAERVHDHAIDDALFEFVDSSGARTVVGVMGGHSTSRTSEDFRRVVDLGRSLTRNGYMVATGGGPGIMEAGNLGAYLANFDNDAVVDAALEVLSVAPKYNGGHPEGSPQYLQAIADYIAVAQQLREQVASDDWAQRYGRTGPPAASLAVPTWFYGHEPTNLFCDHVAKYFSNGIREDVLLAVSKGGVVFAPGSAGTWQEIFMDLAQNHYATFVDRSPMVFMGNGAFGRIHALIQDFVAERNGSYADLIAIFDDPADVVDFIREHPPRARPKKTPLYDLVE